MSFHSHNYHTLVSKFPHPGEGNKVADEQGDWVEFQEGMSIVAPQTQGWLLAVGVITQYKFNHFSFHRAQNPFIFQENLFS